MIVVTGATGFVGAALLRRLAVAEGRAVRGVARRDAPVPGARDAVIVGLGDFTPQTDWSAALRGAAAVVHCAARVHVMDDRAADPLEAFRRMNVEVTLALARQAVASGVRRFVFVSSIKVNGESTPPGRPFTATDEPAPSDPYGISKLEAERQLQALGRDTGLEVVVVRPPLVYGPGVRANFAAMMRAVAAGVPLPLGRVDNRRSLVALDNLVDLLTVCLDHPAAAGRGFLVSDGEDLSTTDLLRRLGQALGRPARLLPVPASWLLAAARLVGRGDVVQRLCGSLQVDIGETVATLGWRPPVSVDEALGQAARALRRAPG
jgi:UDP-4-keto-D-QuiNAc 4-reductase